MYSTLLQNCREGCALKDKFSSSRCQRVKNNPFEGSSPPLHAEVYPQKKSSHRLVANGTKICLFDDIVLRVHPQNKVQCGTKTVYDKSLPVNFI